MSARDAKHKSALGSRAILGRCRAIGRVGVLIAMATTAAASVAADKPMFSVPSAQADKSSEPARVGTVGLVREIKQRGLTSQNWSGVVGSLFTFDTEKDVTGMLYEVTIFFADGSQGEVVVDRDPGLRAGQRVRVTGNRIEALEP